MLPLADVRHMRQQPFCIYQLIIPHLPAHDVTSLICKSLRVTPWHAVQFPYYQPPPSQPPYYAAPPMQPGARPPYPGAGYPPPGMPQYGAPPHYVAPPPGVVLASASCNAGNMWADILWNESGMVELLLPRFSLSRRREASLSRLPYPRAHVLCCSPIVRYAWSCKILRKREP